MARYIIWDKVSDVYTPSGEVFTPEQWIERYGWIRNPLAKPVVAGGLINGAFCGELSEMVTMYGRMGCDFTGCVEDQDFLDAIEKFEDDRNKPVVSTEPTAEERIASALEFQNLVAMETTPIA